MLTEYIHDTCALKAIILNKEGNVYKINGYKSPKIKLENESIIKAF